jgi:hypothetical protein
MTFDLLFKQEREQLGNTRDGSAKSISLKPTTVALKRALLSCFDDVT